MVSYSHHTDLIGSESIKPDDFPLLCPAQGHDALQAGATGLDPRLKVHAFLKLAQVGTVAGGHHRDFGKGPLYQRGQKPEVVTVNEVRLKVLDHPFQPVRKTFFILFQVRCGQIGKTPAGIGHDVAHTHHRKREAAGFEMNEGTLIAGQAIQLRLIAGGDAGQEEILVPGPKGLAHHGPDIDAAAGGLRPLAEGVEDTHKFPNSKFEARNNSSPRKTSTKVQIPNDQNKNVSNFEIWSFGFVSSFEFHISGF